MAKPVIPNKFWILRDQDQKIGQVEANDQGYSVRIHGKVMQYKTMPAVKKHIEMDFETLKRSRQSLTVTEVNGYPIDGVGYNPVFDVKKRLPLYTKTVKSKSWYAAGWYMVKIGSRWEEHFCPKLLLLNRNRYVGPVRTQAELRMQ